MSQIKCSLSKHQNVEESKHLFVVTGMPAAGKTTLASKLASQLPACMVDIDTATESIVRAGMKAISGDPDDRDSPLFKATFRDAIYETLFAQAASNLYNIDVVLTGPFTKEMRNANWVRELRRDLEVPCHVHCVFAYCDSDLRRQRMETRDNPRDRAKLENWAEHLSYYDPLSRPAYQHIAIDTGDQESVEQALGELVAMTKTVEN